MLLELAIGDAYGAGFEYAPAEDVARYNDLSRYGWFRNHAPRLGCYTDDTQMSLALAEAIVSEDRWTPLNLANRFVECFHRDPRFGYAGRFHEFLTETMSGEQFLRNIRPDSDKSGAAMRAAPIGVFRTPEEVIERATIQARLTHDTPDGIEAACAAALMTHYFLYRHGAKAELGAFVEEQLRGRRWSRPWRGHVGAKGWMSVQAAITAVTQESRMTDILRACVDFTGDVDTVATLALAAGSCSDEVEQNLPARLIEGLEDGPYGRDYLKRLDAPLLAKVERA